MENMINSIIAINVDAVASVHNTNGPEIPIAMDSRITYIDQNSLVYIAQANTINWNYDIDRTIASILWNCQGRPDVATVVSLDHYKLALKYVRMNILRYNVLKMLKIPALNDRIVFRMSDIIRDAEFDLYYNDNATNTSIIAATKKLRSGITSSQGFKSYLEENADFPLILIIVNANYRTQNQGHNFHSNLVNDPTSNAYRYDRYAGSRKVEFRSFLQEYGHDMWHLFNNATLKLIADAITGVITVSIPNPVSINNVDYAQDGLALHSIFSIEQAALDRYPIGNIGISAIILGIPCIIYTLKSISTRLNIGDVNALVTILDDLKSKFSRKRYSRANVVLIKDSLSHDIAFSYGYGSVMGYFDDVFKVNKSLHALVARDMVSKGLGSDMAKYIRDLPLDANAMVNSVRALVASLTDECTVLLNLADLGDIKA